MKNTLIKVQTDISYNVNFNGYHHTVKHNEVFEKNLIPQSTGAGDDDNYDFISSADAFIENLKIRIIEFVVNHM